MSHLGTAAFVIAVAASGVLSCAGAREGGPLPATSAISVEVAVPAGQAITWGMPIPESQQEGELIAVELLGRTNLEIAGIAGCIGWTMESDGTRTHCAPVTADGWPPNDVAIEAISGLALPVDTDQALGILVGIRRVDEGAIGTVDAVKVSYVSGGVAYFIVEPWSMTLRPVNEPALLDDT